MTADRASPGPADACAQPPRWRATASPRPTCGDRRDRHRRKHAGILFKGDRRFDIVRVARRLRSISINAALPIRCRLARPRRRPEEPRRRCYGMCYRRSPRLILRPAPTRSAARTGSDALSSANVRERDLAPLLPKRSVGQRSALPAGYWTAGGQFSSLFRLVSAWPSSCRRCC